MARGRRQYWLVDAQDVEDAGAARVLDSMRYDVAQVIDCAIKGFYLFASDIQTAPTSENWRSKGMRIAWQMRRCNVAAMAVEEAQRFASTSFDSKAQMTKARKIARWLIDHGGRRASEAAFEVSAWSPRKIDRVYQALQEVETTAATPTDRLEREIELP